MAPWSSRETWEVWARSDVTLAALAAFVVPGPDIFYVLSRAISWGKRIGVVLVRVGFQHRFHPGEQL